MFQRVDRYLLRLIIVPMMVTLIIAAMLLLLDKMLRLFDFVINEGGPVSVVWQMLGAKIPQYMAFAIPIGVFLGILLAFRRLALSSELDAMLGTGISQNRMLRIPVIVALVMSVITYVLVGHLQPISRYTYEELQYELRSGALGASIKVGEFVEIDDRLTLRIEESRDNGRNLMRIFLQRTSENGEQIIVTAQNGTFFSTEDQERILFRLYNGTLINLSPELDSPRTLRFEVHDLPISLPQSEVFRKRGEKQLELTIPELIQGVFSGELDEETYNGYSGDLNYRLIQIAANFVLPFLAIALGVPPKRSASAVGLFAGITLLIVFNEFAQFTGKLVEEGQASALMSMWVPYLVFVVISLHLYRIAVYKVGAQPTRALDVVVNLVVTAVKKIQSLVQKEHTV
ncbi:MAG: LptF/LptG family permease [Sphingomonadales bacterium]|jgi:lipopolysaccharide export system permease protein